MGLYVSRMKNKTVVRMNEFVLYSIFADVVVVVFVVDVKMAKPFSFASVAVNETIRFSSFLLSFIIAGHIQA